MTQIPESEITFRHVVADLHASKGGNKSSAARNTLRNAVSYDDLMQHATVLRKHEKYVDRLIYKHLGYTPPFAVTIKCNARMRLACDQFLKKVIDKKEFVIQAYTLCIEIRNIDMGYGDWIILGKNRQADIDYYMNHLKPYQQQARDRLAHFLGYYPELDHSLGAEMLLRRFLAMDYFDPRWPHTAADYKAMTVTKYREALLTKGKIAANGTQLVGMLKDVHVFY